jgi:hypothetical protein
MAQKRTRRSAVEEAEAPKVDAPKKAAPTPTAPARKVPKYVPEKKAPAEAPKAAPAKQRYRAVCAFMRSVSGQPQHVPIGTVLALAPDDAVLLKKQGAVVEAE